MSVTLIHCNRAVASATLDLKILVLVIFLPCLSYLYEFALNSKVSNPIQDLSDFLSRM